MKIISAIDEIATAPDRWEKQYAYHPYDDKLAITARLKALPPGFTRDDVEKIIGNTSWTRIKCTECREEREHLATFDDGNLSYIQLCASCLIDAAAKIVQAGTKAS